jgi:hypothetical protein
MSRAHWTLLLHWSGLSVGLEEAERRLLDSLRGVRARGRANVVYELRGTTTTRRGHLGPNGEADNVLTEHADGPAESIRSFARWATEKYPSDHVALVVKGHSGGLDRPSDQRSYAGAGDVRKGLEEAKLRVDVCGLDACDMGLVENAYELRSVASFLVATESAEPTKAFPYEAVIDRIESGDIAPKALAELLANTNPGAFLAAIDLAHVAELKAPLDQIGGKLGDLLRQDRAAVLGLRDALTSFGLENHYVDLRQHLVATEQFLPGDPDVRAAHAALNRACLVRRPMFLAGRVPSSGLSIFFPLPSGSTLLDTYGDLEFSRGGAWASFLSQLCPPSPAH